MHKVSIHLTKQCIYLIILHQIFDFMAIIAGRPLDLASLIRSSSNDTFPYFYFILLVSTLISVGVSFARILTKGKNPVIKNIVSFKFFKVILMLISKLLVQSYILSMAVKSLMFKFVSKGRNPYKKYKRIIPIFLVPIFFTSIT